MPGLRLNVVNSDAMINGLRAENLRMQGQINDILSLLESFGIDMQDCCQQQTTGRNPGTSSMNQMPDNTRLEQNTPNPFRENTLTVDGRKVDSKRMVLL